MINKFVFTGRIITLPKLSIYNKKLLIQAFVSLKNNKKKKSVYLIKMYANETISHQVLYYYYAQSFVIIEGAIKIKYQLLKISDKDRKKKREVFLKTDKIYLKN